MSFVAIGIVNVSIRNVFPANWHSLNDDEIYNQNYVNCRFNLQPLRLDIKRRLTSRSDRVKCVDLHPTEPWMLCALYNGHVHVMNYENQQLFKDFEVCFIFVI